MSANETAALGSAAMPGCAPALRAVAFGLYQPPFRFEHGWIWDANNNHVSDDGGPGHYDARMARVRGWGRLQKLPDGARLQDEVGQMIAEALNAFWLAHNAQTQPTRSRSEAEAERSAGVPCWTTKLPHYADCAVNNEPAYEAGACDCGAVKAGTGWMRSLYHRVCIRGAGLRMWLAVRLDRAFL